MLAGHSNEIERSAVRAVCLAPSGQRSWPTRPGTDPVAAQDLPIERVFAWEDKFRRLRLRFERISELHYAFKTLAYTTINLRRYHCS
ncbi:hypothetical protein [Paraburkholderia pallida]|nr:hypothetical protein [Paraburkholderia pallida]